MEEPVGKKRKKVNYNCCIICQVDESNLGITTNIAESLFKTLLERCKERKMGELHVVFTVLKVLGKMIDGSGLDQCFEEAGIYGNATLSRIKEGKHLYRALEAHFVLYLALHKLYISKMLELNPLLSKNFLEKLFD